MFKFNLGDELKDKLTGFTGISVCASVYLTGCNRYALQSKNLTKDNKLQDWLYFDEDMLVKKSNGLNVKLTQKGGPPRMEAPQR